MNIVLVGAGETGRYIASLLSKERHNVILIDPDPSRLEEASWQMDVATREGVATDWQLLDSLLELSPELYIAVTGEDQANLVGCSLAKNLGYPRTIARVRDERYLNRTRLDFGRIFDVDYFIGPELLVATEIFKYMTSPGSVRVESFAHGAVQLRTIIVPNTWRKGDIPISQLDLPEGMMIGLIYRTSDREPGTLKLEEEEIIFPHGDDHILPGDEITMIGETEVIDKAHQFFGLSLKPVRSAVIFGGSRTSINLARILEQRGIDARIFEKSYAKCVKIAEILNETTVIHHDASDLEFLKSEKISQSDVCIVSTHRDDTNVMLGLLAKEAGCDNVVVQLSNTSYIPIVNRLGIDHTASPRVVASNKILALALAGGVTSMAALHENEAEIMEVHVSLDSRVVGIPIAELGPMLPKDFLIAIIQNRGRVMVADGNRIISPGDNVIVVSHPRHLRELEEIF
ncbi:MAG: Trk system potassium transporter TrkA [Chlamydiales bacterium]